MTRSTLISGGRLVAPDDDGVVRRQGPADVLIVGERIGAVGPTGSFAGDADEIVDAAGCLVVPGALDLHVHLSAAPPDGNEPNGFVDDLDSGTAAAAAGGVTTIGQMSFAEDGWSLEAALRRDQQALTTAARVDVLLIPGLVDPTPEDVASIPDLAAAGYPALKVVDPSFGGDRVLVEQCIEAAGRAGMITLVHCEDATLIEQACAELIAAGHGGLEHFAASRPVASEVRSVEWAVEVCRRTGSPMVLVHLSSAAALHRAATARASGVPVFVETRPPYLHLTDQVFAEPDPGRFTGMPPMRTAADVDALWAGIAAGSVHTVASDHAPWRRADKISPDLDVRSALMGFADLQTMVPMLFSAGVAGGRISPERFVQVTSTRAARLYGLWPRKGSLHPGADADVLVLDPAARWTVSDADQISRAGYSVYHAHPVTGAVRATTSRGRVVYADPGAGRPPAHGLADDTPARGQQLWQSSRTGVE